MEWWADDGKAAGALPIPHVCCILETRSKSDTKQVSAMSWGSRHGDLFPFGKARSTGPASQQ
eukprot:103601-Pyramimonas_sp.AAC.1